MLIPHLHFAGDCREAIALYEKAFGTQLDAMECSPDGSRVVHANLKIQGQTVFLNDRFGNKARTLDCAVHLILTFPTVAELLACYHVLKAEGQEIDPFHETPYSKLCGNFMDRFGVLWGFMADA